MNHAEWDDNILEEEGTRIISLTRNEALFIDDSVTMLIEPEANLPLPFRPLAPKALIPVPANMLDKLGAVILATADNNNPVEIELYISELYILREMCLSYITINGERVGYNLKRKLYQLIHSAYTSDAEWDTLLASFDSQKGRIENIIREKEQRE